jgi:iron-sulfur cluster assembly protein
MNQEPLISLTPNAINHIKKVKQNPVYPPAASFRLAVKKTGCSGYAYVTAVTTACHEEDIRLEVDDIVVFVDKDSVKFLQGTVIDFIHSGLGESKFVFHNPNAANLCGCGESFNLEGET